jgi:RNA polymerase sigma-70 factor (ECF subfamily)
MANPESGGAAVKGEVSSRTVASAAAGRQIAFEVIVREYDERLRTFTFGLLRDRDAMDDVLQDVYLKAYRALPGFRGESRLSTWLFRIAYTTCMSRLRASGRETPFDPDLDGAEPVSPEDLVEQISLRGQLAAALATLPAELRASLLLVHREGLSYEESATILGIAPGTVGWRLNAARKRLASALEEVSTCV